VFPESTPEESDDSHSPGKSPILSDISDSFNPVLDTLFTPFLHRFTLPGIPPTIGEIGGVGTLPVRKVRMCTSACFRVFRCVS